MTQAPCASTLCQSNQLHQLEEMSAFVAAMDSRTVTDNGTPCVSDAGVASATVALFFKLVRNLDDNELTALFRLAASAAVTPEAKADLYVLAWQTRATRGLGKGEKALFYKLQLALAEKWGPETVAALLDLVPHFGYYKDYLALLALKPDGPLADKALTLYCEQLKEDETELARAAAEKRTPKLSLAAKFAPREGTSFDKAPLKLARRFAKALFGGSNPASSARKYRKLVASLNAALNTTEVLMAAGRWEEIKFCQVASLCLTRHRKAFLNESLKGALSVADEHTGNRHPDDPARVASRQHLRSAISSKKGVQGKALQPHELVQKCMSGRSHLLSILEADMIDAQWTSMRSGVLEVMAKTAESRSQAVLDTAGPSEHGLDSLKPLERALPKHVDLGKLVPLVDVSGSMDGTPMEVAIALGILVSELTHDAFKNRVLTFESSPSWVDLTSCTSIHQKVETVQRAGWGGSTDFAAACERILATAQSAKLRADEIPDLICFSDMQFDMAAGNNYDYGYHNGRRPESWETQFERLQRRFKEVGRAVCGEPYPAPRIIFWNLRSSVGFPVAADTPNTHMISGFSPALLKLVLSGADLIAEEKERSGPTPEETLRKALDDECFDVVRRKLSELDTGPLADYTFTKEVDAGFVLAEVKEAIKEEETEEGFVLTD